jgi:hypothetical protein
MWQIPTIVPPLHLKKAPFPYKYDVAGADFSVDFVSIWDSSSQNHVGPFLEFDWAWWHN